MMASRQLPNFLKRTTKKDSNNSTSGRSLSFSNNGASGSIRYSSLDADDHDFFSVSTRASPPPATHAHDHDEEVAQEALIADYSPVTAINDNIMTLPDGGTSEAERVSALGESLLRQASVSSPPDVPACLMEGSRIDESKYENVIEDSNIEIEDQSEKHEESKKPEEMSVIDAVEVKTLLDDIDQTFQSVPKPPSKQRKRASDYAKATKLKMQHNLPFGPSMSSSSNSLAVSDSATSSESSSTLILPPSLSQSLPHSQSAYSVFDQADDLFEHSTQGQGRDDSLTHSVRQRPSKQASSKDPNTENASPKGSPSSHHKAPHSFTLPKSPSQQIPPKPVSQPSPTQSVTPSPTPSLAPGQTPVIPGIHPMNFSTQSHSSESLETETTSVSSESSFRFVTSLSCKWRNSIILVAVVCIFLAKIIPSVSFMLGFIWGGVCTFGCVYIYRMLNTRSTPLSNIAIVPDLRDLPPPVIPHIADEPDDTGGVFRGWLNELNHYRPESYHINQTCSVFVSLDGTQLRIQRPKQNVQKRAMWNEALHPRHLSFIHQRHFDMMGARVLLEPSGLAKKRVWSKKYPICLILGTTGHVSGLKRPPTTNDDFEWVDSNDSSIECIYLFARTCREKEEWFRRFEAAARGKPLQLSLKRIVSTYLEEERSSVFSPPNDTMGTSGMSGSGNIINEGTTVGSATVSYSASNNTGGADSGASTPNGGINTSSGLDIHLSTGPGSEVWSDRLTGNEREPLTVTYARYMARFMPADWLLKAAKSHRLSVNYISCDPQMLWINALLGRAVWDLLREQFWADKVKQKIQNKLRKIHLPYFIDELTVVEIGLGKDFPVIRRAGKPFLNSRGLWIELEIAYSGGSSMALETHVNLMKLRKRRHDHTEVKTPSSSDSGHSLPTSSSTSLPRSTTAAEGNQRKSAGHSHAFNRVDTYCSEDEDSAESTTDSELDENPDSEIVTDPDKGNHIGGGTSRKLLRFVDRISRSSYFHKAIENKFIQRGMEYVSNTRIMLHVEVRCLAGTLLVNIPPPPTDRLWYGFKPCPKLVLAARPKVGEKELTMSRLTEWIEKKLELEFQRIFVMPNMDDLVIPLLLSGNPEATGHPENATFPEP